MIKILLFAVSISGVSVPDIPDFVHDLGFKINSLCFWQSVHKKHYNSVSENGILNLTKINTGSLTKRKWEA